MWARVEIILPADNCCVSQSVRNFKKPASAEAFLAVTEVYRLKSRGDRTNNPKAVVNNIRRSQVCIQNAAACQHQRVHDCLQVCCRVPSRAVRQLIDTLNAAAVEKKRALADPLRYCQKGAVVLQCAHVLVRAQTLRRRLLLITTDFTRMHLTYLQQ